jgi:hypothetical protein
MFGLFGETKTASGRSTPTLPPTIGTGDDGRGQPPAAAYCVVATVILILGNQVERETFESGPFSDPGVAEAAALALLRHDAVLRVEVLPLV